HATAQEDVGRAGTRIDPTGTAPVSPPPVQRGRGDRDRLGDAAAAERDRGETGRRVGAEPGPQSGESVAGWARPDDQVRRPDVAQVALDVDLRDGADLDRLLRATDAHRADDPVQLRGRGQIDAVEPLTALAGR